MRRTLFKGDNAIVVEPAPDAPEGWWMVRGAMVEGHTPEDDKIVDLLGTAVSWGWLHDQGWKWDTQSDMGVSLR